MSGEYPYKTAPMSHQRYAANRQWGQPFWALLAQMGTGKTKIILDEAGALHLYKGLDGLLVLCPKSLVLNWYNEIITHMSKEVDWRFAAWRSTPNIKERKRLANVEEHEDRQLHILVMNVEALGAGSDKAEKLATKFLKAHTSVMIAVDESTFIKNPKAKRTKACLRLAQYSDYRRILSGTPFEQSPMDAWSQFQFLERGCLGYDTFTAFRARYAIVRDMEVGIKRFKIVVGYQNLEELRDSIAPYSTYLWKDDCLDLPEKIYKTVYVPLTPEQRRAYASIEGDAMLELADGALATAPEMITRMLRMHQICTGHMKDDEGTNLYFKHDRLNVLLNTILPGVGGKVIVFGHFVEPLKEIVEAIREKYGEDSVALYTGDTSQKERNAIVERFQDRDSDLLYLVANKTAAYGLTLTAAATVIYYTNQWSPDVRIQSEDRAHRKGQHHPVTYIDMIAPDTIEMVIADALVRKATVAAIVMDRGLR
jgi:SNF2 family DNA or RNA helicase